MDHNLETIVCTIDKDLRQLPGNHYHLVNQSITYVDDLAAAQVIPYLMLVGDSSDNIKGVAGIGPVKAKRIIEASDSIENLYDTVRKLYNDDDRYEITRRLVTVLRSQEDWEEVPLEGE